MLHRIRRTTAASTAVAAVALAAFAPGAGATPIVAGGGATSLSLDRSTARALTSMGVRVTPLAGTTTTRSGALTFPVTGGRIDTDTAAGTIDHRGGLRLAAGRVAVNLTGFRINTRTGTLSAFVNGSRTRADVFRIDTRNVRVLRPGVNLRIAGVRVALTQAGASALNGAFSTHAFRSGLRIGFAQALVAPAILRIEGGATELAVDAGTLAALTSLGVTPSAATDATLENGTYRFPITTGALNARSFAGTVDHTGGITLTAGATTVTLSNFRIDTRRAQLWGSVNGGDATALLDLDLSAPSVTYASRQAWIGNVRAELTTGAAAALNAAFGTTALSDSTVLGVATIKARTA